MSADLPETRISLLLRIRDPADQAAWQDFVEIYQPLVIRIATQKGLQSADAQDLAQEVMTRAAARISDWEHSPDRGTLRGWLSTVARNLVVDFLRQQGRRPQPLSDSLLQRHTDSSASPAEWYSTEERRQIFRWAAGRARCQVQPLTWQAFWMTAVENRPPPVVATDLGMSVGAVYIARSRMMARIRELAASAIEHSTEWKQIPPGDLP